MTVPVLTHAKLSALPGVAHGFFTRRGGVSTGIYDSLNLGLGSKDDPEAVRENRRRAAEVFGLDADALLTCHQVHSPTVVTATGPFGGKAPEADGSATATPGLILGALSADCAPILMADPVARVVAAVHAGWKGAITGVAEAGVEAMKGLGAEPSRIVAVIGPCIGPESYEVGTDFLERFLVDDPGSERFFKPGVSDQKRMFDLPAYVVARLARVGVQAEWTQRDTCAEEETFFSNRRAVKRAEGDYGRLMSAICLTS